MKHFSALLFLSFLFAPSVSQAGQDEKWLSELRNSGSYKDGLKEAVDELEGAFDAESYQEACVARTKGDELARRCAAASQAWAESVWTKVNRQIQSSGLPIREQPSQ